MIIAPIPVIPLPDLTARIDDQPTSFEPSALDGIDAPAPRPRPMPGPRVTVTVNTAPTPKPIPYFDHNLADRAPGIDFDTYVGQEAVKDEMRVYMDAALNRMEALPHTMFASGIPGVGKTTMAMAVANYMGGNLHEFVPPFSMETLYERLINADDFDIFFIDEIHMLASNGAREEELLTIMEEGKLVIDGVVHTLPPITIIGATTDKYKLKPAILSRFMITPYFERYTPSELSRIADVNFCRKFKITLPQTVLDAIGNACQDTPRIARELVIGAKALQDARGTVTPESLLHFKRIEPDGMTREQIAYLTTLYSFGKKERTVRDESYFEYVMGAASMQTQLNENAQGIHAIERFLMDRGLIDQTPRGRRLTDRGIAAARDYIARGLGRGVA